MKFWTLFWDNGKHQFICGPNLEAALKRANISSDQRLDITHHVEGLSFGYYWTDTPPQWHKNNHPVGSVDLHRISILGERFETDEATANLALLRKLGVQVNRYQGRLMVRVQDLPRIWREKFAHKELS